MCNDYGGVFGTAVSIDSIGVVWLLEKMEQHLASAAAVCFALEAIAEDSKWLVLLVPKARELFGKEVYLCQPKTQAGSAGNLSVNILLRRLLKCVIQCRFPWICLDLFFQTSLFPSVR